MAMTLRLHPDLQKEGSAYAVGAGVSLNALLSLALRDYLDARRATPKSASRSQSAPIELAVTSLPQAISAAPVAAFKPPKSRADPCPCGSRLKFKQCHGKTATLP